jgi:hypothetical protein
MGGRIVVITTGIRWSPKITLVGSHATDLRAAHYVRLISKIFFLVQGNEDLEVDSLLFAREQTTK